MEHLSSSIELREDDIGGAQRPVDVLVGRPHGVRPHLHTHMHTAAEERQRHQNSSLEGIKRRRTLGGRGGARSEQSREQVYLDGAHGGVERGEAAVEGAEDGDDGVGHGLALLQRLPQQRRALRKGLHRSSPAGRRCRYSLGGCFLLQMVPEGSGRGRGGSGGRRETGWRRTPPTARREGRRGSNCSCSGGGWGLLSAAGKESEEGGRGTAAESKCKCLSRGPPDAGLSSPVQPWTACLLLGGSYTGTGTLQVVAHGSILHFLSPNVIFFLFFL